MADSRREWQHPIWALWSSACTLRTHHFRKRLVDRWSHFVQSWLLFICFSGDITLFLYCSSTILKVGGAAEGVLRLAEAPCAQARFAYGLVSDSVLPRHSPGTSGNVWDRTRSGWAWIMGIKMSAMIDMILKIHHISLAGSKGRAVIHAGNLRAVSKVNSKIHGLTENLSKGR